MSGQMTRTIFAGMLFVSLAGLATGCDYDDYPRGYYSRRGDGYYDRYDRRYEGRYDRDRYDHDHDRDGWRDHHDHDDGDRS